MLNSQRKSYGTYWHSLHLSSRSNVRLYMWSAEVWRGVILLSLFTGNKLHCTLFFVFKFYLFCAFIDVVLSCVVFMWIIRAWVVDRAGDDLIMRFVICTSFRNLIKFMTNLIHGSEVMKSGLPELLITVITRYYKHRNV